MSDIVIRVEGLSKAYRIGLKEQQHETMLGAMAAWVKSPLKSFRDLRKLSSFEDTSANSQPSTLNSQPSDVICALRGISFGVKHGEAVGIVGRNGAGKSTLLKILARITKPTSGRAEIHGRVGSLLEVGTGFHPDLTGRENVYLNGTILGMKKREVDARFDEIVEFSGVEKFVDTPVKRYSSGMRVRLAFAVAAHLELEILLVDEVLAVGDAEFQKKCLGKMSDVVRGGRTVLFVSHNLAAVSALCDRCVLLDGGRLQKDGVTTSVLESYGANTSASGLLTDATKRSGNGVLRFTSIEFRSGSNHALTELHSGQVVNVVAGYRSSSPNQLGLVDAAVFFYGPLSELFFVCVASVARGLFDSIPTSGQFVCRIPKLPLPAGIFTVRLWCRVRDKVADDVDSATQVKVVPGDFYGTGRLPADKHRAVLVDHSWRIEPRQTALAPTKGRA